MVIPSETEDDEEYFDKIMSLFQISTAASQLHIAPSVKLTTIAPTDYDSFCLFKYFAVCQFSKGSPNSLQNYITFDVAEGGKVLSP
jgi:hypothetical protein